MRMRARIAMVAGAAVLVSACLQSGASEEHAAAPAAAPDPAPPPCAAVADDALAVVETDECPLQLRPLDGGVVLHGLGPQPPEALKGALPGPCRERPCEYEGIATDLGPIVLVWVVSPSSEMPAGAWLGARVGDRLRFVDLWEGAGDEVLVDGTPLGPAHALVPHDCGGTLVLLARARLEAGEDVPPPASLVAREGKLSVGDDGDARTVAATGSGSACTPLAPP